MTDIDRLMGCPFCGAEGYLQYYSNYGAYITCSNTKCFQCACCAVYDTPKDAIKVWNTRHTPSPTTPLRAHEQAAIDQLMDGGRK